SLLAHFAAAEPVWTLTSLWKNADKGWFLAWWVDQATTVDMHLLFSLLVMILCAVQSPADGLNGFFEGTWLIVMGFCFVLGFAWLADFFDEMLVRAVVPERLL